MDRISSSSLARLAVLLSFRSANHFSRGALSIIPEVEGGVQPRPAFPDITDRLATDTVLGRKF